MPTTNKYQSPISRYMPIWNELKAKGKVRLSAPVVLHPRIIKAVKKRKDKDIAYRFALSEDHKKAKLSFTCEGTVITIHLHTSIGLSEI